MTDEKEQFICKVKSHIGKIYQKMNAKPNHCFEERFYLINNYANSLNPKEREWLPEAIQALIDEGLISRDIRGAGQEVLVLTQKGFDVLY